MTLKNALDIAGVYVYDIYMNDSQSADNQKLKTTLKILKRDGKHVFINVQEDMEETEMILNDVRNYDYNSKSYQMYVQFTRSDGEPILVQKRYIYCAEPYQEQELGAL